MRCYASVVAIAAVFCLPFIIVSCVSFSVIEVDDANSDDAQKPSGKSRQLSELPNLLGVQELYDEFEAIPGGKRRPWTVAEKPENIKKNRYDDLLAFDHSRVVLKSLPDVPDSDYINANYINGIHSPHEYIATQGPLESTINDFWRMIVQENVTRIIMLANLMEHGKPKVAKYWPDTMGTYGDYEITKVNETTLPNLQHVIRTFSIERPGINQPQIVKHFHFTGWPDLGVPTDRLQVISIANQARISDRNSKAPIVVHCSAGIGRTGTLILTDSMIQKIRKDKTLSYQVPFMDMQGRLNHMRLQRVDLVEKKEQYLFAFQSVNDVFNEPQQWKKLGEIEKMYEEMNI